MGDTEELFPPSPSAVPVAAIVPIGCPVRYQEPDRQQDEVLPR